MSEFNQLNSSRCSKSPSKLYVGEASRNSGENAHFRLRSGDWLVQSAKKQDARKITGGSGVTRRNFSMPGPLTGGSNYSIYRHASYCYTSRRSLYVYGGVNSFGEIQNHILKGVSFPGSGIKFLNISSNLPFPSRVGAVIGFIKSEVLFIHGGIDQAGNVLSDLWVHDGRNNIWSQVKLLEVNAEGAVISESEISAAFHVFTVSNGKKGFLIGGKSRTKDFRVYILYLNSYSTEYGQPILHFRCISREMFIGDARLYENSKEIFGHNAVYYNSYIYIYGGMGYDALIEDESPSLWRIHTSTWDISRIYIQDDQGNDIQKSVLGRVYSASYFITNQALWVIAGGQDENKELASVISINLKSRKYIYNDTADAAFSGGVISVTIQRDNSAEIDIWCGEHRTIAIQNICPSIHGKFRKPNVAQGRNHIDGYNSLGICSASSMVSSAMRASRDESIVDGSNSGIYNRNLGSIDGSNSGIYNRNIGSIDGSNSGIYNRNFGSADGSNSGIYNRNLGSADGSNSGIYNRNLGSADFFHKRSHDKDPRKYNYDVYELDQEHNKKINSQYTNLSEIHEENSVIVPRIRDDSESNKNDASILTEDTSRCTLSYNGYEGMHSDIPAAKGVSFQSEPESVYSKSVYTPCHASNVKGTNGFGYGIIRTDRPKTHSSVAKDLYEVNANTKTYHETNTKIPDKGISKRNSLKNHDIYERSDIYNPTQIDTDIYNKVYQDSYKNKGVDINETKIGLYGGKMFEDLKLINEGVECIDTGIDTDLNMTTEMSTIRDMKTNVDSGMNTDTPINADLGVNTDLTVICERSMNTDKIIYIEKAINTDINDIYTIHQETAVKHEVPKICSCSTQKEAAQQKTTQYKELYKKLKNTANLYKSENTMLVTALNEIITKLSNSDSKGAIKKIRCVRDEIKQIRLQVQK